MKMVYIVKTTTKTHEISEKDNDIASIKKQYGESIKSIKLIRVEDIKGMD